MSVGVSTLKPAFLTWESTVYNGPFQTSFISQFFLSVLPTHSTPTKQRGRHFSPEKRWASLLPVLSSLTCPCLAGVARSPDPLPQKPFPALRFFKMGFGLLSLKNGKSSTPLKAKKWETTPNLKIGKRLAFSKVHTPEPPLCNFEVMCEGDSAWRGPVLQSMALPSLFPQLLQHFTKVQ